MEAGHGAGSSHCEQSALVGEAGWKYMQNYVDAKTAVVEEILARAREAAGDEEREVDTGAR